jgi:hypothetical protein
VSIRVYIGLLVMAAKIIGQHVEVVSSGLLIFAHHRDEREIDLNLGGTFPPNSKPPFKTKTSNNHCIREKLFLVFQAH